jgi:hypothetical protein
MLLLWIVRLLIVLVFLIIFLRRSTVVWGVGLLTITIVVLLDALRTRDLLTDVGYFSYFLGGIIVAGAYFWLTHVLLSPAGRQPSSRQAANAINTDKPPRESSDEAGTTVDRQMLYAQMRNNLGPDDILDLIFDLGLNENDVINPAFDMPRVIVNVTDMAQAESKLPLLAMSVEHILTPVPRENLPRVEKLSAETPPHLLRQYLVANLSLSQLAELTAQLQVNWEDMGSDGKKSRVRRLLLHLRRRNQIDALIAALQTNATS